MVIDCGECPLEEGSENCKAVGDMCKNGKITKEEIQAIIGMNFKTRTIDFKLKEAER